MRLASLKGASEETSSVAFQANANSTLFSPAAGMKQDVGSPAMGRG